MEQQTDLSPMNEGQGQGRLIETTRNPSISINKHRRSSSVPLFMFCLESCTNWVETSIVRRGNKVDHKICFALVILCYIYLLQMDRLLTFQCDFKSQSFAIDYVWNRQVHYYILFIVYCSSNHELCWSYLKTNTDHPGYLYTKQDQLQNLNMPRVFIAYISQ